MVKDLFKKVYWKLFGAKFFNKILITYIIVVIVVLLLFSFTISRSVGDQLQEDYSNNNRQVVYAMQNYMQEKIDSVNTIVGKIYDDNYVYEKVFGLIEPQNSDVNLSYNDQSLADALKGISDNGDDIYNIALYRNSTQMSYLYKTNDSVLYKDPNLIKKFYQLRYDFSKKIFVSRHTFNNSSSGKIYTYGIINNLIYPKTGNKDSKIMVNFQFDALKKLYDRYKKNVKGYIMILTDEGTVIFDSSDRYYDQVYPYLDTIKKSGGFLTLEEESFADVISSEKHGLIYLSVIPQIEIKKNIMALRTRMVIMSFVCIVFIIILYYFATRMFSRRVKVMIDVMRVVGNNNLTPRIPVKNENDEIGMIAVIFNNMCDNLQQYIEKVYISEIKQKTAQLKALQSQINPHFLYNTLEAIRMGLNRENNEDAGDMIYYLAELFRISLKAEAIVTLKDELEYCRIYLELFSIRYGDKLKIRIDVPEDLKKYGVIKFLLQPIVENYVMHGFSWETDANVITINAHIDEKDIFIVISDNGNGIEKDKLDSIQNEIDKFEVNAGESIGLKNVNERIKLVYGQQYGLKINSTFGKGTDISIKIPAKTQDELKKIMHTQ